MSVIVKKLFEIVYYGLRNMVNTAIKTLYQLMLKSKQAFLGLYGISKEIYTIQWYHTIIN